MTNPSLVADLKISLRKALLHYENNTCKHEELTRGGVLWTICSSCDMKWSDDRNPFKPYKDPTWVEEAYALLQSPDTSELPAENLQSPIENQDTSWRQALEVQEKITQLALSSADIWKQLYFNSSKTPPFPNIVPELLAVKKD